MTVDQMKAALRASMTARFARAIEDVDYRSAVTLILAVSAIDRDDDTDLDDTLCQWESERPQ